MSLVRKHNQQEIVINQPFDQAFRTVHAAGLHVGNVLSMAPATGAIRVKVTKVGGVNPTTIRVSCESAGATSTRVRIDSESFDGIVGVGSAGRSLDAFVDALSAIASGHAPKTVRDSSKMLLAVALLVAVCVVGLVMWLR